MNSFLKRLERFLRGLLIGLARLILRPRQLPGPAPRLDQVRSIVVVRLDPRVGNVLLTVPLLRALRQAAPNAQIDWIISARHLDLVRDLKCVDRLVCFDRRTLWKAARSFLAVAFGGRKYEVAIEASHYDAFSMTSSVVARLTRAPVRVGFRRGEADLFYTHLVEPPAGVTQDVRVRLRLLGAFGVESSDEQLETSAGKSEAALDFARSALSSFEGGRACVVNPGARKPDRRFPPEEYGAACHLIKEKTGLRSLVVWAGDAERQLAERVVASSQGAASLAPPTDLQQLAALMRQAALCLSNDTGPMHLSVACGAPTVGVFTVAAADRWGHLLPSFRAVEIGAGDSSSAARIADSAASLLTGAAGNVARN